MVSIKERFVETRQPAAARYRRRSIKNWGRGARHATRTAATRTAATGTADWAPQAARESLNYSLRHRSRWYHVVMPVLSALLHRSIAAKNRIARPRNTLRNIHIAERFGLDYRPPTGERRLNPVEWLILRAETIGHRVSVAFERITVAGAGALVSTVAAATAIFAFTPQFDGLLYTLWHTPLVIEFERYDTVDRLLYTRLNTVEPNHDYDFAGQIDLGQFQQLELATYRVVPGDTISGIARTFGVRMDTIVSFNQIGDVRRIPVGTEYQIPNRDGLLYRVQRGDTLSGLATRFGVTVNALLDANNLKSDVLAVNDPLFIPDARMDNTELRLILGELFIYPTVGRFTSGFGFRNDPFTGVRRFHNGIDIANAVGTPVRAAMAGRVVLVETQIGNYGRYVIVEHAGRFQSLYGHLSSFAVSVGDYVYQGQQIGLMGNTGRSTGSHLHFSVIQNGVFVDPLRYLY